MRNNLFIIPLILCPLNVFSTPLPILAGEVVARDLDIYGLGWAGHVGITMAENVGNMAPWVVEVLNNPARVIQVNYISTFKTLSPYWGSRYGVANESQSALKVLREANSQRCLRSNYTSTTVWWPATGDLSGYPTDSCNTGTMGQFRCDTFMSYVYSVGGYNLIKGSSTLPKIVFNAFPYGNGDGPYAFLDSNNVLNDILKPISYSIDTITTQELVNLNSQDFVSVVDHPGNSTMTNIGNKIWGFYSDPILSDFDKKYFLLDYLGGVANPDLLPKIIKQYAKTKNTKLKYMLLRSTQSIYNRHIRLEHDLSKKTLLRNFYINLLDKATADKNMPYIDAQIVASGVVDLSSNDIIMANIDKINLIFDKAEPYERIGFKSNLMLGIKSLESMYIPQIIKLLTEENDRQLDERFFSYIIDALFKDTNNLTPEIKETLGDYLNSIAYKFNNINYSMLATDKPSSIFAFGAWLEASALVNSNSTEEAGHYVAEFIKNKSTIGQANYIVGLSKANYMKKAFKTESVFLDFVKNNKSTALVPVVPITTNPKDEMVNSGIQYAVSLIEGKD